MLIFFRVVPVFRICAAAANTTATMKTLATAFGLEVFGQEGAMVALHCQLDCIT